MNHLAKRANFTLRKMYLNINGLRIKLGLGMDHRRREIKAGRSYALRKSTLANNQAINSSIEIIQWLLTFPKTLAQISRVFKFIQLLLLRILIKKMKDIYKRLKSTLPTKNVVKVRRAVHMLTDLLAIYQK